MSTNFSVLDTFDSAFKDRNISIVEFSESSDYCDKPLYPRQRVLLKLIWLEEMDGYEEDVLSEWIRGDDPDIQMCSKIRERRQRLIDEGYKHFREIMLVGGRRSSKGHITGLSIAKKMFDMVMLENPQKHYGIDVDKQIYATIIAAALDQAKQYQYADAIGAVTSCKALEPYFNKFLEEIFSLYTPADLDRMARFANTKAKVERDFASLICKPRAANAGTIRGEATIIAVIDEMAHMLEGVNSKSSAEKIYKAVTPALDQFLKDGMIFQNSSPYTKIGQFYENYKRIMPLNENEALDEEKIVDFRSLGFQFPSWALYKDWEKDKRFSHAFSLPPEDDPAMAIEEEKDPETFKVERRSHFAEVVDSFLNPVKVDEIFRPWGERELHTKYDRAPHGPDVVFKGHADPATTTANFGLAIGHTEMGSDRDGNEVPHVVFDYIHAWRPEDFEDHTINYIDVQDDIVDLINAFRPEEFSFDQFQSRALIDYIRREVRKRRIGETRIREKVATVRVNYQRAHVFKTAINLNLVHAPLDSSTSELAKNELKFLQERNGKVDRQTTGPVITKDVADCMMEVVNALVGNHLAFIDPNIHMGMGAQGGFGSDAAIGRLGEGLSHPGDFYSPRQQLERNRNQFGGSPTRSAFRKGRRRSG
jgi:hypothetical protein